MEVEVVVVPKGLGVVDERNRMMMWLKSCPRCRGDLILDSDYYGHFVSCIQCGASLDKTQHDALQQRLFAETAPELPKTPEPRERNVERVA